MKKFHLGIILNILAGVSLLVLLAVTYVENTKSVDRRNLAIEQTYQFDAHGLGVRNNK